MMQSAEERYRDLIGMEHHRSSKHPHMSMRDRAAQFSPFAALTGYDEEIDEAARLTSDRLELDEAQMELISSELTRAAKALEKNRREGRAEEPAARITYFVPDVRKQGGEYVTAETEIKKIDPLKRTLVLSGGETIKIDDIYELKMLGTEDPDEWL